MAMALRASAAAKPPLSPSPPSKVSSLAKLPSKSSNSSFLVPLSISTLPIVAIFNAPVFEAKALTIPKEELFSSINEVESTINEVQQFGLSVFDTAGRVIGPVVEFVKPGVDVALPVLKQAIEEAVKIASPVVSDASKKAQEAIQGSGFDTEPVITAAKTTSKVIEGAKPIASSTVESILSADPAVIVGTVDALFIAFLLFRPIYSVISSRLRGFKGELTPAQTLDLMSTKNYYLIDIRTETDKDKAGVPRLPSNAKNKMISIPLEELPSKVRNLVRNPKKVQAELVAVKISYLKKINKGSNTVIMDSYSDTAKTVARTLTGLGFKNCWIVSDGFSGSKGWLQSRLGTDSYFSSSTQVLSPSRIIPAATRRLGTIGSAKLLPGGTD